MSAIEYFLLYEFARWQLLAALLVAVLCAILGVYVVLRGMSMLGDGLAHVSFAGVAIGLAAGVFPLAAALALAVAGAILIQALGSRGIVRPDAGIGILFTAGLAVGIVVVSKFGGAGANAQAYLFGNLASVHREDAWIVAALSAALAIVFVALHKELLSVTFSEEAARVAGLPVGALNIAFAAITATSIVVATRIVGVLLVSALLIVPAAASLQFARSFRGAILLSVAFGVGSVLAGILLSTTYGTSTGATVALASSALFAVAVLGRKLTNARGA